LTRWSAHDRPRSRVGLAINSSQGKDKISYYYSFKTQLGGLPWIRFRSLVGLTIDLGQYKDKNNNYYSFKTRCESQSGAKPRLRARLPLTSVNIRIKIVIIIVLNLTKELIQVQAWVMDQVDHKPKSM
jgi:hypothetical protein